MVTSASDPYTTAMTDTASEQAGKEEDLENRLEGAEPLGDGYTNRVYLTERDTVIKVYDRFPLTSVLAYITNLTGFDPYYPTRSRRMKMEVRVKEELKDTGLSVPEVVWRDDTAIEFTRVEGEPLRDYVVEATPTETRTLGRRLGSALLDVHGKNVVLKDLRIANLYANGDEIASIDHEYGDVKAKHWEAGWDLLTLLSSAKHVPPPNYRAFLEGFQASYGDVPLITRIASSMTSPLHALFFEHDLNQFWNSIRNSVPPGK